MLCTLQLMPLVSMHGSGDADPMTQVDSISGANLSFGLFLNAVCMVSLLLSESDGSPGCASSQEAVIQ